MAKNPFDSIDPQTPANPFDDPEFKPRESRSAIGEIANQGWAGIISDLPSMAGKALQYASDKGKPLYNFGKDIADAADERGKSPELQADPDNHGTVVNALASGARMIPQSLAPAAAVGAGLALLPEAVPGALILGASSALGSLPAAMSQGQQTLDKAEQAGVPDEVAIPAARKTALIEGAGETLGTLAGAKILGLGGKALATTANRALGRTGASAAEHALGDATNASVIKPWAKTLPESLATEVGTEMGQNAGEAYVEQQAGIDKQSPWDAAKEAVAPTVGMTALLAPFGLVGHGMHARANGQRAETLASAESNPLARAKAAFEIQKQIAEVDPAAAENFRQHTLMAMQDQAPLEIGPHLLQPPTMERRVGESNQANADLASATDAYTGLPADQQQLGYNNVIIPPVVVPRQDGQGVTTIDRSTGPLSAAAADAVDSGLTGAMNAQVGPLLRSYPTSIDAQAEIDARPDGDRMQIIRHPRATDRFAVVPKTAQALQAMDAKAALKASNEARTLQAEQEDGNAAPAPVAATPTIDSALTGPTIDDAAHTAATSPLNGLPQPTEAQQKAGNYPKGHVRIGRLDISVENPVGSTRSGVDAKGKKWSNVIKDHYGYIKGTIGNDKDHVDAFVKQGTPLDYAGPVYVIDQVNPSTGAFDEHKTMIGYASEAEAVAAYKANYAKGWKGLKSVTAMPMSSFEAWVKDGPKNAPLAEESTQEVAQDELQPSEVQPTGQMPANVQMGARMAEAARKAAMNRAEALGQEEAPAEPKKQVPVKPKAAPAEQTQQNAEMAAQDAAQDEVGQSTGKMSARRAGESNEAYMARRAAESNERKKNRSSATSVPTASSDLETVMKAFPDAEQGSMSIADAESLPDADKAGKNQVSKQSAAFIRQIARLFGKRVVFVDGMAADGFVQSGNAIFLSTNSTVAQLRVMGHELVHTMKSESRKSYNHMMDALKGLLTDAELEAQFKDYFPGQEFPGVEALDKPWNGSNTTLREFIAEEWVADLGGNRFGESEFWNDVFKQVEAKHGTEAAKGIIAKLRMAIVNALQKLLKLADGGKFAVDERLAENLGDVRKAVAEGFAMYAQDVKNGQVSTGSDDTKFATQKATGKKPAKDPAIGDRTDVSKLPKGKVIPDSAAVGGLESSLGIARGKTYAKGRDLKVDIQDAVLRAARAAGVKLSERTQETHKFLSNLVFKDATYALRSNENAIGWYDSKISRAIGALAVVHPEINTDPTARMAFMWSLAVTSNGLKVAKNFELAEKAYRTWRDSHPDVAQRTLPSDVGIGNAAGAINDGMTLFNTLSKKMDQDRLAKFMATEFPAGSISQMLGTKAGGEWAGTPVRGAAILGPKIGNGFYMNLNGYFDALTMDRWLMRTFGRMTGTLLEIDQKAISAARDKFKAAISKMSRAERATMSEVVGVPVKATMTKAELDTLAAAVDKTSMKTDKREKMQASETMNRFRLDGRGLSKQIDGQKEAPSGPAERNWIRAIFKTALDQLKADGKDMTMSDLQALLWYPERRLYDAAKSDDTTEEGYEDDEAPDYANAALALALEHGHSRADVIAAMDKAEAAGTIKAKTMTDAEKEAMAREFRAPPDQGVQLAFEVAPDPADVASTVAWNSLSLKDRTDITKEVKDEFLPQIAALVDANIAKSVGATGGFGGQVNPNIITEYQVKKVSLQKARTLAAAIGLALDQDSVAVVDPRISTINGLIRITFSGKVEKYAKQIFDHINSEIPEVSGFTARGNNFDVLNFTGMSNDELGQKVVDALEELDIPLESVVSHGETRSELVEKDAYESHLQGSRPESGQGIYEGALGVRDRVRARVNERIAESMARRATAAQRGSAPAATAGETKLSASRATGDGSGREGARSDASGTLQASERTDAQEALKALPGAPNVPGFHGPDPQLVSVAEQYARDNGIKLTRQGEYVQVDPERAKRIADAYEAMPHAPQDPVVKEAYQNLIKQTTAQYKALEKAGYKFWLMDMSKKSNEEYASSPWNAMRDIRENKVMGVFPTEDGFGSSEDFDPANNPLLEDTGIKWPSGSLNGPLKRVLANDLFRAVHDAFGHGLEGSGFRAQGEENAWQAHSRLFTGSALGAITSETRGQNSWLNYGPHGEKNRTAKVEDTKFADQKTGLMPEWTWTEGRAPDAKMSAARVTETPEFKQWSDGLPVHENIDDAGSDRGVFKLYHATTKDFSEFKPGGLNPRDSGPAIWLATDPNSTAATWRVGNEKQGFRDGANIMPVYAKLKSPLLLDTKGTLDWARSVYADGEFPQLISQKTIDMLKEDGYDSIIYKHDDIFAKKDASQNEVVVFEPTQIKSATGNSGAFNSANPDIRMSTGRQPFYSALSQEIGKVKMQVAPAFGWKDAIKGMVNKGLIKQDEVEWTGLNDWLDLQTGKVTRDQVQAYLDANGVQVKEVTLGKELFKTPKEAIKFIAQQNGASEDWVREEWGYKNEGDYITLANGMAEQSEGNTKYGQYTLPGGENYREVLLTLPNDKSKAALEAAESDARIEYRWAIKNDAPESEQNALKAKLDAATAALKSAQATYTSSHWDQKNVLAHIRVNDRTDADGNKVLFVEEVQSDWGQDGKKKGFVPRARTTAEDARYAELARKSFSSNGLTSDEAVELSELDRLSRPGSPNAVPTAPFVTKTEGWLNLALKRIITMAVDGGYDKVAFVNGEQSADRYDLSKQVDSILAHKNKDGSYYIQAEKSGRHAFEDASVPESKLEGVVGKELAQKIIDGVGPEVMRDGAPFKEYKGGDLKVGGEGMKTFYDKIVPNAVSTLLKKTGGGKLSEMGIAARDGIRGNEQYTYSMLYDRDGKNWVTDANTEEKVAGPFDSYDEAHNWLLSHDPVLQTKQISFTVTPAMQEKASGGLPMFSKQRIVGDKGRTYTPEQLAAFDHIGARVTEPTLKERFDAMMQDAGKKMAQGIADQFAPVKDIDGKAYGLLRLAKGASGAFEALLKGGKLKLTDGTYDFDDTARGGVVDRLLKPLGLEHHDFFRWIAANRAEALKQVGKEHLFTQQDITALKTLATGQTNFDYTLQHGPKAGQVTRNRAEIYQDSLVTFNEFNKNVLDMAEQSGLIDGSTRHLWEGEFYVPFYRVADDADGGVRGMNIKGAAVRQQAFKALKGGKQALNADLMDNVLMNWAHLLDASAKNRAAKATIEAAEKMGIAMGGNQTALASMGSTIGNKNGVVWFMDGGQKRYSLIDNTGDGPYIMTALTSLEYAGMRNPVMNAMGAMKHVLTVGVTASPFFKVRNLIRDSVQVVGSGPISYNVAKNLKDGWKNTNPESDQFFRLLAGGGTIHFGSMLEGSESKRIQALVESGVDASTILNNPSKVAAFYNKVIKPGLSAYNHLGDRLEAVNRAALYDQLIAKGASHADAALQARDLMDFSMQGSWTGIRFLTQVVPFMNARIQGLYKLGRAGKEDPARLATVLGTTALLSLGLLAAYGDDDDWKKRTESDRNNFWWFKVGGIAYRIPKPFEVGSIGTLAERGMELMFDKEMTNRRFLNQVMSLLSDNLSMNPIPQLVKPIMDVYANKDSLTGNAIETMSMDKLKSAYRYNDKTSMTARAASTAMNAVTGLVNKEALSPVQIDYMLHGYFGWLGAMTVTAADIIARPASDQATQARPDWLKGLTGNMASDLRDAPSRYIGQMYDQAKVIEEAHGTWQELIKERKFEDAKQFREDNADILRRYPTTEAAKKSETLFNNMLRMVERNRDMSADEKREKIRQINEQKNNVAKRLATM